MGSRSKKKRLTNVVCPLCPQRLYWHQKSFDKSREAIAHIARHMGASVGIDFGIHFMLSDATCPCGARLNNSVELYWHIREAGIHTFHVHILARALGVPHA